MIAITKPETQLPNLKHESGDISSLHPQGLAKCLAEYQVLNIYLWTELMKAI